MLSLPGVGLLASTCLQSLLFFRFCWNYLPNERSPVLYWKGLKLLCLSDFCSLSWKTLTLSESAHDLFCMQVPTPSVPSRLFSCRHQLWIFSYHLSQTNQAIIVHFLVKCLKYSTSAFQRRFPCLCSRLQRGIFLFDIIFSNIINLFILSEGDTRRRFSFKSLLFISLNSLSISKFEIPFDIFSIKWFTNQIKSPIYNIVIYTSV